MSRHGTESMAAVYAEALAEAAEAKGLLDQVGEELAAIAAPPREDAVLVRSFFESSAIRAEAKAKKIEAAFRGRTSDLFTDFLLVLLRRNRLELRRQVAAEYQKIMDVRGARVPVTITTASEPSPEDLAGWKARLRATLCKEPVLRHRVDPALVGGMVLRVGDVLADGSVRRALREIRDRVAHAGRVSQGT